MKPKNNPEPRTQTSEGWHSYVPPTTIYPAMPPHQPNNPVYTDLDGNPVSIEDFPSYIDIPVIKLSKVQRLKLWFAETRESICDAWDFLAWLWEELHRTDLGDSEHYANGFRKFSAFELDRQIIFIVSVISLIVSVITLIVTL